MHGDALTLISIGVLILAMAIWRTMHSKGVIGSTIHLSPKREAAFNQEVSR